MPNRIFFFFSSWGKQRLDSPTAHLLLHIHDQHLKHVKYVRAGVFFFLFSFFPFYFPTFFRSRRVGGINPHATISSKFHLFVYFFGLGAGEKRGEFILYIGTIIHHRSKSIFGRYNGLGFLFLIIIEITQIGWVGRGWKHFSKSLSRCAKTLFFKASICMLNLLWFIFFILDPSNII